jgi:hypothetical protein
MLEIHLLLVSSAFGSPITYNYWVGDFCNKLSLTLIDKRLG